MSGMDSTAISIKEVSVESHLEIGILCAADLKSASNSMDDFMDAGYVCEMMMSTPGKETLL